jgi:hypothetical protein
MPNERAAWLMLRNWATLVNIRRSSRFATWTILPFLEYGFRRFPSNHHDVCVCHAHRSCGPPHLRIPDAALSCTATSDNGWTITRPLQAPKDIHHGSVLPASCSVMRCLANRLCQARTSALAHRKPSTVVIGTAVHLVAPAFFLILVRNLGCLTNRILLARSKFGCRASRVARARSAMPIPSSKRFPTIAVRLTATPRRERYRVEQARAVH